MNNDEPIPLKIIKNNGSDRSRVVVSGVPLPIGYVFEPEYLIAVDKPGNVRIPLCVEVLSRWPDGSICWCLVKAMLKGRTTEIFLQKKETCTHFDHPNETLNITIGDKIQIIDGDLSFTFGNGIPYPSIIYRDMKFNAADWRFTIIDEHLNPIEVEFGPHQLVQSDSLSATVTTSGKATIKADCQLELKLVYDIYVNQEVLITCEVHNPQRANHLNGIWDLGDKGSILFESISLCVKPVESAKRLLRVEQDGSWQPLGENYDYELYQASSGGKHWNSVNHVNHVNQCTNEFKGYRLIQSGSLFAEGTRASPSVILESTHRNCVSITPIDFWQNFPKKIIVAKREIKLELFPGIVGDKHELQGGERKQHRLHFGFGNMERARWHTDSFSSINTLVRSREAYDHPLLLGNPVGDPDGKYSALLKPSLHKAVGFFAKRESQDEYGWRHYGDVVADHESLYVDDHTLLVSHYNNQYDCIYGFARQYLLTGNTKWYRLMDDLARHVLDIDIYRTEQDRVEYNNGLFWHTDHYKSAATASHRTYSRAHFGNNNNRSVGGGPGAEHCYTTGLKFYYYLTGSVDAKDSVIKMTEWVTNYYEGSGTFIEFLKSLAVEDLKKLLRVLGGKRVLKYRYPFSRGVGNYIRALMDCHELTSDMGYLNRVASVINNTFSASDDISMRNLQDIEGTWFYTVFLQEVIRFLDIKRLSNQFDSDFYSALNALIHYAGWMADNEKPYLFQPDKLEFPNDTWAAQEIRKAIVLYGAYRYAHKNRDRLLRQARFFRDHVIEKLSKSDTLHYARIQALLLQNHGPADAMNTECLPYNYPQNARLSSVDYLYGPRDFVIATIRGFSRVLRTTSARREYAWVRSRLRR